MFTVKKLRPDAQYPTRGSERASGLDLRSVESAVILGGEKRIVPTGLSFEIPEGYELQVRNRSGLTARTNLDVKLGTIDNDYSGEVGVICHNTGTDAYTIFVGDRIAQIVLCPVSLENPVPTDDIPETKRGSGSYGSTGIK